MRRFYAVLRSRGDAWDESRSMEEQPDWPAHAAFMDYLAAEGFVLMVGPMEGTRDVLLIALARDGEEVRSRLSQDPWSRSGLLRTATVAPWTLRLGTLDRS